MINNLLSNSPKDETIDLLLSALGANDLPNFDKFFSISWPLQLEKEPVRSLVTINPLASTI